MAGKRITLMAGRREMLLLLKRFGEVKRKMRSLGFSEVLLKPA